MGGRTESIIPQQPTGAARKRDYTWPDPNVNSSGGPSSLLRDRPGASNNASGAQSAGTSGALTMGVINGVTCCRFTNGVNIGGGPTVTLDAARLRVNLTSPITFFNSFTDDYAVYRFYAITRVTATPVQANGNGIQLVTGNNIAQDLFVNASPGFAINYDNTGTMSLVIRDNAAATLTSTVISPAGFTNTDFHTPEFRLISAQPGVNATLKVLLDGKLRLSISWPTFGAVNLPTPAGVGGNVNNGFGPSIHCNAQNSEMDVAMARVQMAPTEADLF